MLICAIIVSVTFSSCFLDFAELLSDTQPTTQEATQPKPLEPTEIGYGYEALEPELKDLYRQIHESVPTLVQAPEIKSEKALSVYQMRMVIDAYIYDHPEIFWLDSKYLYWEDTDGSTSIEACYTIQGKELISAKKSFEAKLDEIISNAPKNATAYELELYVHDYLFNNCEYDDEAVDKEEDNAYSAYGAIVEKSAVCSGYSKAFQLLCNKLGVECVSITGMSDNEHHQWNCVKLDDSWYQVDLTWNDSEYGELCRYDYFNLTDEQMYKDHSVWKMFSEVKDTYVDGNTYNVFVPKCTSETYNYYNYSCLTISDIYNSDDIVEYIAKSAKDSKKYVEFVIDESLDYSDTVDTLLYEGYMYEWIEKSNRMNDYSPELDPECKVYDKKDKNVVTIELTYIGES